MAAKGENKNPKCATVIPANWPKFTGPKASWKVDVDRSAWFAFVRAQRALGPTPRIYRGPKE